MSISIRCPACGRAVTCQVGTVKIGSFLTCGACGHCFECRGEELRTALQGVEDSLQQLPRRSLGPAREDMFEE